MEVLLVFAWDPADGALGPAGSWPSWRLRPFNMTDGVLIQLVKAQ